MGYVAAGYLTVLGGLAGYAAWLVRRSRQLATGRPGGAPPARPSPARQEAT